MKHNQYWLFTILIGITICFSQGLSPVSGQNKKAGQESCDGALDVVPAKALSFSRKRRPVNSPPPIIAQPTPTPRKKTGK
jgi:hypothetical protein